MTSLTLTARDSRTMLRRNLVHIRRYPSLTFIIVGMPVVFLLLFVYVFGETLGDGLAGAAGSTGSTGRAAYLEYLTPGILLTAIAGTATGTAVTVAMDMTEGVMARFRTMAIARPSVLTGHVLGSFLQAMFCALTVLGVAVLIGFRPDASPLEWIAVLGVLAMAGIAVIWFAVGCGLVSESVETASNLPMPLLLLPFFGSAFVPADSMPGPLAWFAEYQPFTPIIETLRGLLTGTPVGHHGWLAIAWCLGIAVVCSVWSVRLYDRDPA